MDWKQILSGVVVGAVLGIASTFFLLQGRVSKLEAEIENLKNITSEASLPSEPESSGSAFYFLEANGEAVMEAEHFTDKLPGRSEAVGNSWRDIKDFSGYTGDSALQALPNTDTNTELETNGPVLLYVIRFQTAGDYYVYVRGFAPSHADDSVHVGLTGNAVTTSGGQGLTDFGLLKFTWQNHYNGIDTVINIPAPGVHTFYLWMREDGMVVDKIWLSTKKDAVSNGNTSPGPEESPRRPLGE